MENSKGRCLVTGGAGFIGSHIVDKLVEDGYSVRVIDNLTTGHLGNLAHVMEHIEFIEGDIRDASLVAHAMSEVDTVYHVAALPSVPRSLADPWESHDANLDRPAPVAKS